MGGQTTKKERKKSKVRDPNSVRVWALPAASTAPPEGAKGKGQAGGAQRNGAGD